MLKNWRAPKDISFQCDWGDCHECEEVGACVCPCHIPEDETGEDETGEDETD